MPEGRSKRRTGLHGRLAICQKHMAISSISTSNQWSESERQSKPKQLDLMKLEVDPLELFQTTINISTSQYPNNPISQ